MPDIVKAIMAIVIFGGIVLLIVKKYKGENAVIGFICIASVIVLAMGITYTFGWTANEVISFLKSIFR